VSDDKMKILVMPVDQAIPDYVVPGSVKITADCGHECWIARTSLAQKEAYGGEVVTECVPCSGMTAKELRDQTNAGEIKAAPGAIDEINDHAGFNIVDLMRNRIRIQEIDHE
jgi:hypothetical protein